MRTSELVQRLQAARQNLQLPQALTKLDRYDLLILDDLSYVRKDQAETSVLFELIAERYERRSILITANQPFSGWDNVFPDPGMTVAAIDRLVHHSTIFELHQVESYRGKEAARQQKIQRDNEKQKAKHARQTAPAMLLDAVRGHSETVLRRALSRRRRQRDSGWFAASSTVLPDTWIAA
jgi:IstB-like ATP binding protein